MIERVAWGVLALIHVSPFAAFFVPSLITRLYSVPASDPDFALLHHRAALFGAIFIACVWAAIDGDARKLAATVTALSMISFLIIYLMQGQPASLRSIAAADLTGLPFLAYVSWKAFSA